MAYDLFDFTESLERVGIKREQCKKVLFAYGRNGDLNEWDGGFRVELTDGRHAHITGGCDTTGWGCQDYAHVDYIDDVSDLVRDALTNDLQFEDVDHEPADLNRWINGETEA